MTRERDPERRARVRENMRRMANSSRDTADEMAAMFGGVDDMLHPGGATEFRDWQDFVDRVARPLVEAEDDEAAEQAAMKLFRTVSPYYICLALVMMDNRLKAWEDRDRSDWPDGHLCTKCGQLAKHHPFLLKGYECDRWRRD